MKVRTLIADDDLITRLLLSEHISSHGTCDTVVDGAEAVRAYRLALQRGNPYNLICLDVIMPNMGGIETLAKIRSLESEHNLPAEQHVPIIMISALVDELTRKTSHNAKCDAYLTKPIEPAELTNKLKELKLI